MRKESILIVCSMTLVVIGQLSSQEKPQPASRATPLAGEKSDSAARKAVPTINLPEFDIMGEEVIRLDAAEKSAVEDSWDLRSSTLERGAPRGESSFMSQKNPTGLPDDINVFTGRTVAGLGSFQTPMLDLWLGVSSPTTGLLLRSGYSSSAGHVDHADYRDGYASVTGNLYAGDATFLPGDVTLSGTIGFSGRAYRFYGSPDPQLQRTINRVQGDASAGGDLRGFTYETRISVNHTSVRDESNISENEIGLRTTVEKGLKRLLIRGSVDLSTNQYPQSQDPYIAGMTVDLRYDVAPRLEVVGGLGFYATQGSSGEGDGRLYPVAGILWRTTDRLTLSARFAPFLQRSSLSWLMQQNPYLVNTVDLKHPDYHTNLEFAGDMEITELIAARLAFKYQRADNVPLYEEQVTASGTPAGQWDIDYSGTTRIFGLDAEVSAELTPESYALVSIAWRGTENSVTGHALPYAPAFQAGATYRHIFPIGLTLQTDLNIFGPQFADRSASQTLNGYTLWGVSAEYEVIPQLGVGVAFENLLGQDYQRWNGYESIPQTAMLFGRYRW